LFPFALSLCSFEKYEIAEIITRQCVIHVKAIKLDILQMKTPIDEDSKKRKEKK